jgi:hypothetical protein
MSDKDKISAEPSIHFINYKKAIDNAIFLGTGQAAEVDKLLQEIQKSKRLFDTEKLELEAHARSVTTLEEENDKTAARRDEDERYLPVYDFNDDYSLPDGLSEFGFNKDIDPSELPKAYGAWLRDGYLPNFISMPNSQLQYDIAVCFTLLNPNAVLSKKQYIPHPYFLGSNGSGKTEMAELVLNHYPRELCEKFLSNCTGAGMRDAIDAKFCNGISGLTVLDNFNPRQFMERAGNFYDLLLTNNRESAVMIISGASNEKGKSKYLTYSYKILTSVFPIANHSIPEMHEIERRTIPLLFKSGKPRANRIMYDWTSMQEVYKTIWGKENLAEITKGRYGKALSKLAKYNPELLPKSIPDKKWIICQVPIAVGVYCGIFESVEHGIQRFGELFEYTSSGGNAVGGSALATLLITFMKEILPTLTRDANPYISSSKAWDSSLIPQEKLTEYLAETMGHSIGRKDLDELIGLMASFGYSYGQLGSKAGFKKN